MRTPRFISRRIPAIILALVMVFSLSSLTAFADPVDDQSWYDDNPNATEFYISTADELAYFATVVNNGNNFAGKTVTLTQDVDIAGLGDANGWIPIANATAREFKGTFDGSGHTVSNLKITRTATAGNAFVMVNGGTIKNLGLLNVDVNGAGTVGGLVGQANAGSVVENCFVQGVVKSEGNYVGGIIGRMPTNTAVLRNSYANVTVNTSALVAGSLVGGLTGTITNCYSTGTVTSSMYTGGIGGMILSAGGSITRGNVSLVQTIGAGSSSTSGRILGNSTYEATGTTTDNYAWNGIRVGYTTPSGTGHDDARHGADTTGDDIYLANVWESAGFSDDVWNIKAGRLPALKAFPVSSQPVAFPSYIPFTVDPIDPNDDEDPEPVAPSITLTGDAGIKSGEDARFAVSASNISKLATVTAWFESDAAFLTAKEFNGLNDFSVLGDVVTTEEDGKTISQVTFVNLDGGKDITDATEIIEAIFSTSESVSGDTAVKLTKVTLSGYDEENVAVFIEADIESDTVETSIELSFSIYDVNRDGTVDQLDLTTAQLYYQTSSDDANWNIAQRADVNDDGTIDIADFILILNNIVW